MPISRVVTHTHSTHEDPGEGEEGRDGARPTGDRVWFRAISVPLRLAYGRMRGRVVEKNMRARRCIVYPALTFYPKGGGRRR